MKEDYIWNYNIKIKTKEGTYEYENVPLEDMTLLVLKHPDYTELQAKQLQTTANNCKKLVKKNGK